jgi:RNase H-like domain found in reverse transcriptase
VKDPKSRYDDVEVPELPGVRKFVLEHIQNLDRTLADLERAGATLSAIKSMFCMAGLRIVGYICDAEGRHPESAKVLKILEWARCCDLTEAQAFLGICGYYRIWIEFYALIAESIYRLFRKGHVFKWDKKQAEAMEALKDAITSAPALVGIDYRPEAGEIIAAFDASKRGWGAVLMQLDEQRRRHPARYESGIWSPSEMNYDAGKLECKAVLKGLKKFRQYLYGVHFIMEVDAKTLVAQLNRTASDLPGALITRWLAWIRLFDFDVRHVPGKKNVVADGLSRKPPGPSDLLEMGDDDDIEDFIDGELDFIRVTVRTKPVRARVYPMITLDDNEATEQQGDGPESEEDQLEDMEAEADTEWNPASGERLRPGYSEESIAIAQYLTTLRKPPHMSRKEFRRFKLMALQFMVHEGHLFKRASKNMPLRRVVDSEEDRAKILQVAHEESGHRGREGTYRRVADRY